MTTTSKTFTISQNLKQEKLEEYCFISLDEFLYESKVIRQNKGQILVNTNLEWSNEQRVIPPVNNGFVGTLLTAYNQHLNLILRPDDLWLAITTAFGLYINAGENAENLRKHFVTFEGKKELTVDGVGTIFTVDWSKLINQMSDKIEKNTVNDTRVWLEPNFSTTTPVAKTVGQVVMMGVLKNYFDFKFYLMCGLPQVTLEGTLADWKNLKERVQKLKSFGVKNLSHWADLLDHVLNKFVESYEGKVDKDFWKKIASIKSNGSGPSYLEGWVNVFLPFTKKGEYRLQKSDAKKNVWPEIDSGDIPPSTVECPVTIDDNGREYKTIFYGGHLMCSYDAAKNSIRPSLDWAMVDVTGSDALSDDQYAEKKFAKPAVFTYGA